jgi:hypothetical protein
VATKKRTVTIPIRDYAAEFVENADGTFDLIGVEILSAGGPVFGKGSPPEGDFWTVEDLVAMAAADAELGDELLPPNKIGHPDAQTLVANSIDAGDLPAKGEMPAVGWLEDLRVEGQKLLADIKQVPKIVAEVIEKGAYRTRSTELSRIERQDGSGKVYEWVVTGLAWLGGTMPAVRTLGDVVALYEGELPVERVRVIEYENAPAEGTVVWKPDASFGAIQAALQDILAPGDFGSQSLWVMDISIDAQTALVTKGWNDEDAWVVPFTIGPDGDPIPAPSTDWIAVEQSWLASAKEYAEQAFSHRPGVSPGRADTRPMKFTDDQRRTFAEATGLELDAVTDEILTAAGVTGETPEPIVEPVGDAARALEVANAATERTRALEEELRVERRNSFVEAVLKDGKLEPGQREFLEVMYDANADKAREYAATLKPDESLAREYGKDEDDTDPAEVEGRSYESEFKTIFGYDSPTKAAA